MKVPHSFTQASSPSVCETRSLWVDRAREGRHVFVGNRHEWISTSAGGTGKEIPTKTLLTRFRVRHEWFCLVFCTTDTSQPFLVPESKLKLTKVRGGIKQTAQIILHSAPPVIPCLSPIMMRGGRSQSCFIDGRGMLWELRDWSRSMQTVPRSRFLQTLFPVRPPSSHLSGLGKDPNVCQHVLPLTFCASWRACAAAPAAPRLWDDTAHVLCHLLPPEGADLQLRWCSLPGVCPAKPQCRAQWLAPASLQLGERTWRQWWCLWRRRTDACILCPCSWSTMNVDRRKKGC